MERFTHSIKVLWRTERLLLGNDFRLSIKKFEFSALAGLVGVFGLAMLGVALFFALVPYMGYALAALTVGGLDLVMAAILIAVASSLKPGPEVEMVREMRNTALNDIEDEVAQTEADILAVKNDVTKLIRHPMGAIGPLMNAVVRGIASARK